MGGAGGGAAVARDKAGRLVPWSRRRPRRRAAEGVREEPLSRELRSCLSAPLRYRSVDSARLGRQKIKIILIIIYL